MKIVVDQNIPLAEALFGELGQIQFLPGRSLQAQHVADADVLLVRSITQVNSALLENSPVKFVGTCTIGLDHMDTDYLDSRGIHWANAPGCNANAVVQYVLSAMAKLRPQWQQLCVGIIGCGNIGSRLNKRLSQLGVDCLVYDPFVERERKGDDRFANLETVLSTCDIITLHTPLTKAGEFPTYHMLNNDTLKWIKDDALLINSCRGAVIDNEALLSELERRSLSVVLDVWENEPNINRHLLSKVDLASPHIAGYSVEGKEMGSYQVYQALCGFLNKQVSVKSQQALSQDTQNIDRALVNDNDLESDKLNQLLLHCYDIAEDDALLRGTNEFDRLRKEYRSRREYPHFLLPDSENFSVLKKHFSLLAGASQ